MDSPKQKLKVQKTSEQPGIRVRNDLEGPLPMSDTETSSSREIIDIADDTEDSTTYRSYGQDPLPPNLSFVGVINCSETRLYPTSELAKYNEPLPKLKSVLKTYIRNQPQNEQESLLKVLPTLTPCLPKLKKRNEIKINTLPPMPKLKRKPTDDDSADSYEIEYLDETNESDNITEKINKNFKNLVKNQNLKNRILMYQHFQNKQKIKKILSKSGEKKNEYIVIVDKKRRRLRQARLKRELEERRVVEEKRRTLLKPFKVIDIPDKIKIDEKEETSPNEIKEVLSFNEFISMLKLVLPEQWSIVSNRQSVQIFRTDYDQNNIPKIALGVMVSRTELQVHVYGSVLKSDHPMWKNISEQMQSKGNIRLAFMLQLLAWLHPQQICLKALETKAPEKCEYFAKSPLRFCPQCHPQKLTQPSTSSPPPASTHSNKQDIITLPLKTIKEKENPVATPKPQPGKLIRDGGVDKLFSAIKFKLERQIARLGVEPNEVENVPKTQEEVLASMGLQRRESSDKREIRKSKRERKSTPLSLDGTAERRDELRFLICNWDAVTQLFTENLSFGTYANLDRSILIRSYKGTSAILRQWHSLKGHPFFQDYLISCPDPEGGLKMDKIELRNELCNNVREINRLKRKFKSMCPLFSRLLRNELEMKPKDVDSVGRNENKNIE